MSRKSDLYALRRTSPEPLSTTYKLYTMEVLEAEIRALGIVGIQQTPDRSAEATQSFTPPTAPPPLDYPPLDLPGLDSTPSEGQAQRPQPPRKPADPDEMPGQRLNTQGQEPLRVDELGREWYQEEVLKPAYPKPRGRRVLKYNDTGVDTETVQNGQYVETFEVAGKGRGVPSEVKITLPSYQVGIFKDPRFPFKIHTYNSREGFDLYEVQEYFGGAELVPESIKRVYIENDLCYDVRSTIRTIQAEHRQLQLTGRIK